MTNVIENPYLREIKANLPRLLGLFDADSTGTSYGIGDRFYWAWGLIDFGNGTFQGAAHGLARLWCSGLWPYPSRRDQFLTRIDALFQGAARLTRSDGSLEEAFPNEGSFCVTALVAFDLLCAIDLLSNEVPKGTIARWREVVRPMVRYLLGADETHAIISNHLATAVAALVRWNALTGDIAAESRANELLERILNHQSKEGWFLEYEGPDPGYQSLCTYYLADVHRLRPDWHLGVPLLQSVRFLWHFAHPDGSFGGVYGSRCTRFYYPAGIEALAPEIPEAASLAQQMASSINKGLVVTLAAMDEPNLAPMFNCYCWAAELWEKQSQIESVPRLPSKRGQVMRLNFPEAGIWIDSGAEHYTIVNTHKGGVVAHFRNGRVALLDSGIVVRNPAGRLGSSQAFEPDNRVKIDGDTLTIESSVSEMPKQLPTPIRFIALRLLCVTAFRSRYLREWVKQILVYFLITRKSKWPASSIRRVCFGPNLVVQDRLEASEGYVRVNCGGEFVAIHMASQGYWQRQDEEPR